MPATLSKRLSKRFAKTLAKVATPGLDPGVHLFEKRDGWLGFLRAGGPQPAGGSGPVMTLCI